MSDAELKYELRKIKALLVVIAAWVTGIFLVFVLHGCATAPLTYEQQYAMAAIGQGISQGAQNYAQCVQRTNYVPVYQPIVIQQPAPLPAPAPMQWPAPIPVRY